MPEQTKLIKAELQEIGWTREGQVQKVDNAKTVTVQFNPETLKMTYSSQKAGGNQAGGSAIQFVGQGTTKLSLDLIFDVTVQDKDSTSKKKPDVRRDTLKVIDFIKPKEPEGKDKFVPPGIRFRWGSFLFEGVVDSINETLEFFSRDGRPLRASISLSLSRQEIQVIPPKSIDAAGTQPLRPAQAGDSIQQMAARDGKQDTWQQIAQANGIENPRNLLPGTLVNLNQVLRRN